MLQMQKLCIVSSVLINARAISYRGLLGWKGYRSPILFLSANVSFSKYYKKFAYSIGELEACILRNFNDHYVDWFDICMRYASGFEVIFIW